MSHFGRMSGRIPSDFSMSYYELTTAWCLLRFASKALTQIHLIELMYASVGVYALEDPNVTHTGRSK
jgi:hypothetical protein